MRFVIYAIPFVLAAGIIAAGLANWRSAAAKIAVLLGVVAIAGSAFAVGRAETALAEFESGVQRLEKAAETVAKPRPPRPLSPW